MSVLEDKPLDGPEDENDLGDDGSADEMLQDTDKHTRKRRVKVRKRIRVKKKSGPKKRLKKLIETIAWVIVLTAFIITLIMLVRQLEFNPKTKGRKTTELNVKPSVRVYIFLSLYPAVGESNSIYKQV